MPKDTDTSLTLIASVAVVQAATSNVGALVNTHLNTVTFAPVPEPETYPLFLAGLGLVGLLPSAAVKNLREPSAFASGRPALFRPFCWGCWSGRDGSEWTIAAMQHRVNTDLVTHPSGGLMKIKLLLLLAVAALPAWAVQTAGSDAMQLVTPDASSGGLVLAGLGLMATIARRRFK